MSLLGAGKAGGGGGITCSSSQGNAFLARLTGSPDNAHKTAYCTLIDGLVTDGVWSKLDALYKKYDIKPTGTSMTKQDMDDAIGYDENGFW